MIATALVILTAAPSQAAIECDKLQQATNNCPADTGAIADDGVDIGAGYDVNSGGGSGGTGGDDDASASEQGSNSDGGASTDTGAVTAPPDPYFQRDGYIVNCIPGSPCDPALIVRVSEVAHFRATAPTQAMEPDGWAITGLPINFYAVASVNVQSGTLLGYPADVRFTPVGYRWDYGDGTATSSGSGGSSWAALGLPEFSPTSTSHVFTSRGVMAVTLSVEYAAEYRFAGRPWRAVQGTLALSADPIIAVTGDAKTVLVGQDCSRNPRGPGC